MIGHDGEIFVQSGCQDHENSLMDFFQKQLQCLGYHRVNKTNKVWQRNQKTVVVCLGDHIATCAPGNHDVALSYAWPSDATVITDNYVLCPTQYQVFRLPDSYFGIYYYQPQHNHWQPNRRFNFSVNRIDVKRLQLFLELVDNANLDHDYINFNCWHWERRESTVENLRRNFRQQFENFGDTHKTRYSKAFDLMVNQMPFKNHNLGHEQSHVSSWLNMVIETYHGDNSIALSEKTFRVLQTAAPWSLYACKYTVARLIQLGFDVCDDLVNHRSDLGREADSKFNDRGIDWIWDGKQSVQNIQQLPFDTVFQRCQIAAEHNKKILQQFRLQWPVDFANWLPSLIDYIR